MSLFSRTNPHRTMMLGLIALSLLYTAGLGPFPTDPAFGDDNSQYLVSAEALAQGFGYRFINFPDNPIPPYAPPGYPLLLAVFLHFLKLDPLGITLLRLVSIIACLTFIWTSYWLLTRYLAPRLAAGIMLVFGVYPVVFFLAEQIFSDCVFSMLAVFALILTKQAIEAKPGPAAKLGATAISRTALLAGLCAGLAILTRTAGIFLIFGMGLALLVNAKWRQALLFALPIGIIMIPWQIWSEAHKHENMAGAGYATWAAGHFSWASPVDNLHSLLIDIGPHILLPSFDAVGAREFLIHWHLFNVLMLLELAVAGVALLGLVILLRRRDVVAFCMPGYLAVIIMFPGDLPRYFMPVMPLLVIPLYVGAQWLAGTRQRGAVQREPVQREPVQRGAVQREPVKRGMLALLAVCLVLSATSGLWLDLQQVRKLYLYRHWYGKEGARGWRDLNTAQLWMRRHIPDNGIIITSYAFGTYLFTGRKTIFQSTLIGNAPIRLDTLIAETNRRYPHSPLYVFATLRFYSWSNLEFGLKPVAEFKAHYPDRLKLMWLSPDSSKSIYKVVPP